jgi:hypothetical protein
LCSTTPTTHRTGQQKTLTLSGSPSPLEERAGELLAGAVADALAEGTSWSQIGARLGVPPPTTADGGTPTDRDWQNAVAHHENTGAQQRHRGRSQEYADPPDPPNQATRWGIGR